MGLRKNSAEPDVADVRSCNIRSASGLSNMWGSITRSQRLGRRDLEVLPAGIIVA